MGVLGKGACALVLIAAAFATPTGVSGSSAEAEITDPSGDGVTHRDIVKVWFEQPDEGNISISVQLASAATAPHTTLFALHDRVNVWFVPTAGLPSGMTAAYVCFTVGMGTQTSTGQNLYGARLGFTATAGTYGQLTAEVTTKATGPMSGTTITTNVPLNLFKGFTPGVDAITKAYANVVLTARGPTATDNTLNQIIHTYDRAPNSGNGKDFVTVGAAPSGPAFNLTGDPGEVEVPAGGNATAQLVLSNPGGAALNLSLTAPNVTDGYTVSFDETNVSVPAAANLTANVSFATSLGAGNSTNITIFATDEAGNSQNVTLVLRTVAASAAPTASATNATSNATGAAAAAADSGSGIPGLGLLGVGAAVAVAIARRRRA